MSLTVTPEIVDRVDQGDEVTVLEFVDIIRGSLPFAWEIFAELRRRLINQTDTHVIHDPPTMDDETRGQILRAMASNAIRQAIETYYGYRLAFQNCHKVGAFRPKAVDGPAWNEFTSIEAQILNQAPDKRDC